MKSLASLRCYIENLVSKGGPSESDDIAFMSMLEILGYCSESGVLAEPVKMELRSWFGNALSPSSMQGMALQKPHGYAGDFEIIDRIYLRYVSSNTELANWDHFYHRQPAPRAVRNRKTYFHELLDSHSARRNPLSVLNIASGPGRCMFEWLSAHTEAPISIDCVELDATAIDYARNLNRPFLDRITFEQKNALRYKPSRTYDLIWAAGIFDYFNDEIFCLMIKRLLPALANGGELVIGNFSNLNPSRAYMELIGEWVLHHRSSDQLSALAAEAGVLPENISVGQEPEGVNLFLHIRS